MEILAPRPLENWVQLISQRWQESLDAVVDVGRMLCEAKRELRHGEFEKMVEGRLPFKSRTAQRLMAIYRDDRLARPEYRSLLPSSWCTLYEITKLSDDQLNEAVQRRVIRSDSQRWEIDGFRAAKKSGKALRAEALLVSFPSPDIRRWTIAQLRQNSASFTKLLAHVGNASDIDNVGDVVSDERLMSLFNE